MTISRLITQSMAVSPGMAFRAGRIVQGATRTYQLLEALKAPTVYKAKVLSGPRTDRKWALVKSAQGRLENVALKREYNNYRIPGIASSPFIRTLYDPIGSFEEDISHDSAGVEDASCLVFEWMDTDLHSLSSRPYRRNLRLPEIICKSVLSALGLLKTYNATHTDVNPNNIFLSDVSGSSLIVKLGDLGTMVKEGYKKQRIQCLPCRAPEVWQGIGCFHSSDIWSVGITLAHWLCEGTIFGAEDKIIEDHTEAWCIAKLQTLVGKAGPCIDYQPYKDDFELAEQLMSMELGQGLGPPVSTQLLDFIDYLLVIDMATRPMARDALENPYLRHSHPL